MKNILLTSNKDISYYFLKKSLTNKIEKKSLFITSINSWSKYLLKKVYYACPGKYPTLINNNHLFVILNNIISSLRIDWIVSRSNTINKILEARNVISINKRKKFLPENDEMKLFLNLNNILNIFLLKNNLVDFSNIHNVLTYAVKKKDLMVKNHIFLINFPNKTYILKKFLKTLSELNSIQINIKKLKKNQLKIFKYYLSKKSDEYRNAIIWSKKKLEKKKLSKICIVIPNLKTEKYKIINILHEEKIQLDQYSFILSKSIKQCIIVKIFIYMLDLFTDPINYNIFSYLLRSPYISNAFLENNLRLKSDTYIKKHKEKFYYIDSILKKLYFSPIIKNYLNNLKELKKKTLFLKKDSFYWMRVIEKYMKIFGFPNKNIINTKEKNIFKKLKKILYRYTKFNQLSYKQTIIKYITSFKNLLLATKSINQTYGNIIIKDLNRVFFIDFDYLWVCSFLDKKYNETYKNPFLPIYLQDTRISNNNIIPQKYYCNNYNLSKFIHFTKIELNFSFLVYDIKKNTNCNFFLTNLKIRLKKIHEKKHFNKQIKNTFFIRNIYRKREIKRVYGGTSSIYNYYKCSFKSYFMSNFPIYKKTELNSHLFNYEKGIIIHEIMRKIWGQIKNNFRFKELNREDLSYLVRKNTFIVYDKYSIKRNFVLNNYKKQLETKRLLSLVSSWFFLEKKKK